MEALYLILLLLVLGWSIFNKYFIPKILNLPPTPSSALPKIIAFTCIFKQPMHRILFDIASRHGPVLLLNLVCRRVLVISSAAAAEDLYTKSDVVFANRPKLTPAVVFGNNCKDLVWAPHGRRWRHLRSVSCLGILPFHRLPDQYDSLADEVKQLIRKLYINKDPVELKPMFLELVFNVMMRMFAGKSVFDRYCHKKMSTEGEDKEPISLLEFMTSSFRMTTSETDSAYFMPILKLLGLAGFEKRCRKLQRKGSSIMDNIIEEVRKSSLESYDGLCKKEENVIQFLLDKQTEDPKLYSDEVIRGLVLVLVSAGTDTTAAILEWAFALLLNHPEVLRKGQEEIDKCVGNDRLIEQADIENLPYLRCIVKETLRLYPSAPLLIPHESSSECKVGGYNVPKGTMLMLNVWAIHHDPDTWKEATKFNPGRFEGVVDERGGFKLMPFGYGRRSCPGKHMSVLVITMALGSLIQCFDWERSPREKMVDLSEQTGLALLKAKPLMAICRPRSVVDNLLS